MKKLMLALLVTTPLIAVGLAQSTRSLGDAYEILPAWGELPPGTEWGRPSQITSTADDLIVVLRRSNPFFLVFDTDGKLVKSWGEDLFANSHGVRVDREGFLWATDNQDNLVQKFTMDGELLMTLGQKGIAGDNRSPDAFDGPTDVFVTPNGDIFVSDGERNSRVVQFSKEGEFIRIIGGTQGAEPGQFNVPHAVVVDSRGRLIVADAENERIQVFDQAGNFLEEWTDFPSKPQGTIYITEDDTLYVTHVDTASITIMKNGEVLGVIRELGGRPHGVTMDRDGNLHVANTLPNDRGSASGTVTKVVRR